MRCTLKDQLFFKRYIIKAVEYLTHGEAWNEYCLNNL